MLFSRWICAHELENLLVLRFCSGCGGRGKVIIIIIIIIIIIVVVVVVVIIICYQFMQDIYNSVPETYNVCKVHSVAIILYLQIVLHVMLFPKVNILYIYWSTFRSTCLVPSMAVYCISLIFYFRDILFRYFLNDFEVV